MMHQVCIVLVAGMVGLYGGGVAAMIPDWPQTGWIWAREQRSELSGLRLFQRELSAPMPPAAVARILSARLPQLNRLMVLDGQILLSGLDGAHHWLARVGRDAVGTRAMVSALAMTPIELRRGDFDPALYVPTELRLQFSHAQTVGGRRTVQAVYRSAGNPSAWVRQVEYALSRSGWHRQDDVQAGGGTLWRRAGERVRLRAHEQLGGGVLWLQHQEAGEP